MEIKKLKYASISVYSNYFGIERVDLDCEINDGLGTCHRVLAWYKGTNSIIIGRDYANVYYDMTVAIIKVKSYIKSLNTPITESTFEDAIAEFMRIIQELSNEELSN